MTLAKLTRYAIYGAGIAATALAMGGFGTFDIATGRFDPNPFNIYDVVQGAANVLAFIALAFGWGRK